jgi:hypothetical protein
MRYMDFRIWAFCLLSEWDLEYFVSGGGTSECASKALGLCFHSSIASTLAANREEGPTHRDHSTEARVPGHGDRE